MNQYEALLDEYAELKKKQDELSDKIDEIKAQIEEWMESEEVDKIEKDGVGTFSLVETSRWEYPDEVEQLREEWMEAKKAAKQKGFADREVDTYLRFDGE